MRIPKGVTSTVLVAATVVLATALAVPLSASGASPGERSLDSVEDRPQEQGNETVIVETITVQQLRLSNVTVSTSSADRIELPDDTLTNASTDRVVVNGTFQNVTFSNVTIRNESLATALGVSQDGENTSVDTVTLEDRTINRAVLGSVTVDNVSDNVTVRNRTSQTSYSQVMTDVPDIEVETVTVGNATNVTLTTLEAETGTRTETEDGSA